MIWYRAICPICERPIESPDSQADAYADRDTHMLAQHPDEPDTTHDARFPRG